MRALCFPPSFFKPCKLVSKHMNRFETTAFKAPPTRPQHPPTPNTPQHPPTPPNTPQHPPTPPNTPQHPPTPPNTPQHPPTPPNTPQHPPTPPNTPQHPSTPPQHPPTPPNTPQPPKPEASQLSSWRGSNLWEFFCFLAGVFKVFSKWPTGEHMRTSVVETRRSATRCCSVGCPLHRESTPNSARYVAIPSHRKGRRSPTTEKLQDR